jgi:hypothetical protein
MSVDVVARTTSSSLAGERSSGAAYLIVPTLPVGVALLSDSVATK